MFLSRRLIVHILLALMLFVGVSSAAAAPAADHQVVTGTASFTIPADQCSKLPAGVSVSGSGQSVAIINTRTRADGSTEISINNVIKGVAIDSNEGKHKFVYENSSTETILSSGLHTFSMTDTFTLSGPGPNYSVGFYWRWTYTPPESLWPPVHNWEQLRGDPVDIFGCDPL
jgi:hypothetical protein